MGTKIEAAHALMVNAARLKDAGQRNDVEAGMAKLLASEYCAEVVQESFRIHGGYGYSKEYEIERLMREAPFLLIGEGTSEIQKTIISRGLLKEYKLLGSTLLVIACDRPDDRDARVLDVVDAGGLGDRPRLRRDDALLQPDRLRADRDRLAGDLGGVGGRPEHVDQVDRLRDVGERRIAAVTPKTRRRTGSPG